MTKYLRVTTQKENNDPQTEMILSPFNITWDNKEFLIITYEIAQYRKTVYIPKTILQKVEIIIEDDYGQQTCKEVDETDMEDELDDNIE